MLNSQTHLFEDGCSQLRRFLLLCILFHPSVKGDVGKDTNVPELKFKCLKLFFFFFKEKASNPLEILVVSFKLGNRSVWSSAVKTSGYSHDMFVQIKILTFLPILERSPVIILGARFRFLFGKTVISRAKSSAHRLQAQSRFFVVRNNDVNMYHI